ncbi:hypothetical protein [Ruegeria arenilitoris]|uniref:hypothetical protein n=1 Tax=Ruegeria arenilitoris TaxID=1173585 RepID=UPI00147EC0B0|nr:hypothetical protein [Ruegeria arenilitoris]
MKYFILGILLTLYYSPLSAQTATPEIPNASYNDIAAVFPDPTSPTGAVIIYNPTICQNIGAACGFFRVHEHGHVALGHHLNPHIHPFQREFDADRFAATYAAPNEVFTAWQFFVSGWSSPNIAVYDTPANRAKRVCAFAKQINNWIGPTHAC